MTPIDLIIWALAGATAISILRFGASIAWLIWRTAVDGYQRPKP